MYFVAASLINDSDGYGQRPIVKVIGAKTNFDSAVLPFGVLQEILNLQRPKPRRKPVHRRTRPVTIKIYKDNDHVPQMKKINYLRGVDNYYEFAGSHGYNEQPFYDRDTVYSGDAYSVRPYSGQDFLLVDKDGDEIADLKYVRDKGIPKITKVEPIIIGKRVQEHVYLEVKK